MCLHELSECPAYPVCPLSLRYSNFTQFAEAMEKKNVDQQVRATCSRAFFVDEKGMMSVHCCVLVFLL
jgi:hypothetical protein